MAACEPRAAGVRHCFIYAGHQITNLATLRARFACLQDNSRMPDMPKCSTRMLNLMLLNLRAEPENPEPREENPHQKSAKRTRCPTGPKSACLPAAVEDIGHVCLSVRPRFAFLRRHRDRALRRGPRHLLGKVVADDGKRVVPILALGRLATLAPLESPA